MTALEAALAAMDHPWRWGTHDCCAAASSAFLALNGIDPMMPLRGEYSSEAEAIALIEAWGGWEAMTASLADLAGLRQCQGAAGAIGLHKSDAGQFGLVFGIGSGKWAGKSARGMALVNSVERAWK